MAFFFNRAQGHNQHDLIDKLWKSHTITIPQVRDVMYQVDRKNYVGDPWQEYGDEAYIDAPLPIGHGQTISAPHMHAHALEEMFPYLKRSTSSKLTILDVGCGSGYLTATLGRWVDDKKEEGKEPILGKAGKVYGIDVYPELVEFAQSNIQKEDSDLLLNEVVTLSVNDGWKGLPDKAPFDAIHVGAAADAFPHDLMIQLKVGGILLVPVGSNHNSWGAQGFYKVERLSKSESGDDTYNKKDFKITKLLDVRYVPLVHTNT